MNFFYEHFLQFSEYQISEQKLGTSYLSGSCSSKSVITSKEKMVVNAKPIVPEKFEYQFPDILLG